MGRKIPGKKHKGIKDPEKQRARRWAELKLKVNEPPKNTEEQHIPKSLKRVMELTNAVKSGKIVAKKKKKRRGSESNKLITLGPDNPRLHPKAKPEKSVPIFNQNSGESKSHFMARVNRETALFVNETLFENKYKVEIKRNPVTGDVEGIEKASKDEIDELMKMRMKHKNVKKKKKRKDNTEVPRKLTKVEKRKEKVRLKKEKRQQDREDRSGGVGETVKFGEIVHAPPNLKIKRGGTHCGTKNLLLRSILDENKNQNSSKIDKVCIDKSGKRKELPSAERRLLEQDRRDVIAAYRHLKNLDSKVG